MSCVILTERNVKCKITHRCIWCGEYILTGEIAVYRAYVFDGDFNTDYMHIECIHAMHNSTLMDNEGFDPYVNQRG